jgi:SAM-dependent methyltransferase
VIAAQDANQVYGMALAFCHLAGRAFDEGDILDAAAAVTGQRWAMTELLATGARIWYLKRVLSWVCGARAGNGAFSRWLTARGAQVVAFDFSTVFIELAKERTIEYADRIEYRIVDATDERQLLDLGVGRFDAATANMVLMDMASIETLAGALAKLLKPGGRVVFSIQHPCFNSNDTDIFGESGSVNGIFTITRGVRVRGYLDVPPGKGAGMVGEPNPHYYFHRPLHELFFPFFDAGFMLNGLEERAFPVQREGLMWGSVPQIPPVLVVRMIAPRSS